MRIVIIIDDDQVIERWGETRKTLICGDGDSEITPVQLRDTEVAGILTPPNA